MLAREIITERYINAVGFTNASLATKEKYAQQVWEILQRSYASIGGIKGTGFNSVDDMISTIPFWKIAVKDGRVRAVILYKDKEGRKSVAIGTDGSPEAAKLVDSMVPADLNRSYGEKSKAALGKLMKLVPWERLEQYVIPPTQVMKLLPGDEITPAKSVPQEQWPEDAKFTVQKYPQLLDYAYFRDIGGEQTFKIMTGKPGNRL